MKGIFKKSVAVLLTAAMAVTPISMPEGSKKVQAEQLGSLAKEVTGTWSYWDGKQDVVQTNKMLFDKLPTKANQMCIRDSSYIERGEVFANAQTGNMLLFGVNLSVGNFHKAIYYFCPILAFTIGIMLADVCLLYTSLCFCY